MKRASVEVMSIVFLLLSIIMVLSNCGGGGGGSSPAPVPGPTPSSRQWTYMVYMGADNNLSEAGLVDLNEMEAVGSTTDVAIVTQSEFSPSYTPGVPTNTLRFYVQKDNNPNSVNLGAGTSIGNVDMGSPATLTAFIQWAKQNYPAQHYALVVWDHGAGWKERLQMPSMRLFRGAVQDATSGSFMSLPDLAKAVSDSGVHFDVINFDACLMAMYEVAYQFNGLTDYMVFSEETEPGEGDPYDTIVGALAANPSMTAQNLAKTIVDKYDQFFTTNNRGRTTKSAVDMAQLATLDTKILALVTALKNDASSTAVMSAARVNTQEYAYKSNHDLWHVCDYLGKSAAGATVKTAAAELKTAITSMVIDNQTNNAAVSNSHGLAIFLPQANETNATEMTEYASLACNQARAAGTGTWGSYIETLLGGGGGTATYRPGGWALYLWWSKANGDFCDADLDLYVWEPAADFMTTGNGQWYAPWMGQTSPQGFFSLDSSVSGKSEEFFQANEQVLIGDYSFVINFYDNGTTCTSAHTHLYVYDPAYFGDNIFHELTSANVGFTLTYPSPQTLSLLSPIYQGQTITSLLQLNAYNDYWVPDVYYSIRAVGLRGPVLLSDANQMSITKNTQLMFRNKKGLQIMGAPQ